jgi:hypothetical protein
MIKLFIVIATARAASFVEIRVGMVSLPVNEIRTQSKASAVPATLIR